MKFRVLNPRRRKSRKARRQIRLARSKSGRFLPRGKKTTTIPMRRRRIRSRRRTSSRRLKHVLFLNPRRRKRSAARRSRRYRNPMLALANPRRRRSSRRRFAIRRRHRNPGFRGGSGVKAFLNRDILTYAVSGVAGFWGARLVRDTVSPMLISSPGTTTESLVNIGLKLATAGIGGMLLAKFNRKLATGFAIGAATSATFDVWAMVTGKPMSLNEYVAPRSLAAAGQARRLGGRVNAYTGFYNRPRFGLSAPAFGSAFSRAF